MGDIESAFAGNGDQANAAALEHVGQLIAQLQPGSMVQRFVLLVETIDADDRWLSAFVAPGQKQWDTLGMLDYGTSLERNAVGTVGHEPDDLEGD